MLSLVRNSIVDVLKIERGRGIPDSVWIKDCTAYFFRNNATINTIITTDITTIATAITAATANTTTITITSSDTIITTTATTNEWV